MTCIEKLRELHPDWDDEKIEYYKENICPAALYIKPKCGDWWVSEDCKVYWDTEVPEDESTNIHETGRFRLTGEDMRRLDRLAERTGYSREKVVSAALKIYEDGLDAVNKSVRRPRSLSFEVVGSVDMVFDEQE